MDQNPYESPQSGGIYRTPEAPNPKRAKWYDYVVVTVIILVLTWLLIPAIQTELEQRRWRSKSVRDPKTGRYVPIR